MFSLVHSKTLSFLSRFALTFSIVIGLPGACSRRPAVSSSADSDSNSDNYEEGEGGPPPPPPGSEDTGAQPPGDNPPNPGDGPGSDDYNRNVDILLVVDSSGSMGEEQGLLANAFPSLIDALERYSFNFRIGITTVDMGRNLYGWCPQSGPMVRGNQGSFMLTSCLDRLDEDFLRSGGTEGDLDRRYTACTRNCRYTTDQLNIRPTTTHNDPEAKPRPWLESIDGQTNVDPAISMADALACFAPTGIKSCGFEMQLESHARALEKTNDPERPEYGFTRPDARLVVLHLTDEVDCSTAKENIFDPDGDQVFWNADGTPTSYICWAAGVECTDDGWCFTIDRDGTGAETGDPSQAVLHPLSRYMNQLGNIENTKQTIDASNEVIVALIGGVQGNGPDATFVYEDVSSTNPAFHNKFGIGKGCSFETQVPVGPSTTITQEQFALPPVRLREFTAHFTEDSMYSICQDDYSVVFEHLVDRLRGVW